MELDALIKALKVWGIIAYGMMSIFTFGHAANNITQTSVVNELSGFAGILWPLYWSWELQRPVSQSDSTPAKAE